jgi:uncharacterized integral membrane protein
MNIRHRSSTERTGPPVPPKIAPAADTPGTAPQATSRPAPTGPVSPGDGPAPARPTTSVSPTRTSMVWAGVWATAVVAIMFIVFLLQNTTGVKVSFLGLHGTLPLAVALLIALVAGILLTLVVGTARITQLRLLARHRR